MSAVCVLTPIVIASWPTIVATITSVAATMGFTVATGVTPQRQPDAATGRLRVETQVPASEVIDEITPNEQMVIASNGVTITFSRDDRGACKLCVEGENHSKAELEKIGQAVAGRLVQQFAYHKLMTELKQRHYRVLEEQVAQDQSIRMRVRLDR